MNARRIKWAVQASYYTPIDGDPERLKLDAGQFVLVEGGRDRAVDAATNAFAQARLDRHATNIVVSVLARAEFTRSWVEAGTFQKPATGGHPVMQWSNKPLFGEKPMVAV